MGDSWGTYGESSFYNTLIKKGSGITANDICVGGTTAEGWDTELFKDTAKAALSEETEVVWITLMGNDVQEKLPLCGFEGKSPDVCVAELIAALLPHMQNIIEYTHEFAPNARIVGFGYDLMGFAGAECTEYPLYLLPGCNGDATCVNTHFLKVQGVWDDLAKSYAFVDSINLLGSLQAAAGSSVAKVGSPDLAHYSPESFYGDCIHPNEDGFDVLFSNMYDMYLHKYEPKEEPSRLQKISNNLKNLW